MNIEEIVKRLAEIKGLIKSPISASQALRVKIALQELVEDVKREDPSRNPNTGSKSPCNDS